MRQKGQQHHIEPLLYLETISMRMEIDDNPTPTCQTMKGYSWSEYDTSCFWDFKLIIIVLSYGETERPQFNPHPLYIDNMKHFKDWPHFHVCCLHLYHQRCPRSSQQTSELSLLISWSYWYTSNMNSIEKDFVLAPSESPYILTLTHPKHRGITSPQIWLQGIKQWQHARWQHFNSESHARC